jgi:hypothetical protein
MTVGTDYSANLMVGWILLNRSKQLLLQRNTPHLRAKSFKETADESKAILGSPSKVEQAQSGPPQRVSDTQIKLADLIEKLKNLTGSQQQAPQTDAQKTTFVAMERRETEITIEYRLLPNVDGLVVRNKNLAETDRYAFEFQDGATFRIIDKWSGKSTTIWGDPHVDTSDQDGSRNGEFSDLKNSNTHTSMILEDGTRITFTALDNGIIEAVDINKGNQHLTGIGGASRDWSAENNLFAAKVDNDANAVISRVPLGDVVYAGGDGNDWFDTSGKMIWGATTGPRITSRPYATTSITIRQTIEQAVILNTQA